MKCPIVILFLVLHFICTCKATLLIDKAAYFANSVFKQFITSVVWWHDNPDDITEFLTLYQGCVVLTPVQDNENDIIREFNINNSYKQTVFFAKDVDELEYFIALLNQDLVKPIRLIVVLTKPATNSKLSELMETAWKNDVADMLIVSSNGTDVMLTTYFPYANNKCGDFTPVHLDHDTTDFFPRKFSNFHGCEIRVSLLHMSPYTRLTFDNETVTSISGIDGNIFCILFEVLNARMNIISAKDHDGSGYGTINNGTATGSCADLVNKEVDIAAPAIPMSYTSYPYVQFSHTIESIDIRWFGPRQLELSEGLRLLHTFMSNITPALFTASILFVVVTMIAKRFTLPRSYSSDSVLFQSFIIFLGQEVKFVTKSWLTNSLFMSWIWFCMVVRIAYQGDLVHGMQKNMLESPLRSFEYAVTLVDGYGGTQNFKSFYKGTKFYNDYEVISFGNLTDTLKAVAAGKKFLVATDLLLALDAAPTIQILGSDPVTKAPVSFYMRPGWPAVPEINGILLRIIETGFTEMVLRHFSWEWAKDLEVSDKRGTKPLSLETLTACFYGLGIMYLVCFLVFIIEIIYDKTKKKYLQ